MGQFPPTRRRPLVRADLGVPPITGRTTRGLRREEVAYLAGVSVTWYTWLEQGRAGPPPRQVLDSLARPLRLSHAEHVSLLSLGGYSAPRPAEDPSPGTAPAHVQRLLDALADYPALAIAPDWTILAWNAMYAALYPNVTPPAVGDLQMEQHSLTPSDTPGVHLVIFTPTPGTDPAERLRRLLDMHLAGAQSQPSADISVTG